ncbi:MAG: biotin/lipoyl-binding protein, partial [Opitutaceae bacterium]
MTAESSTASETSPSSAGQRRRRARTIAFIVLGAAALAWAGQLLYHYWRYEETDDAYVSGHVHQISPQADGQIVAVLAHENEFVKRDAVLARLDPLAFQIAVRRAQALAAQARAD